ncbi:MAG: DmsE family decaheme c-type cytochrome [Gammaproteobacteria bacterium]|nr:DmsE family decaheme c-type cytochrome [Gammaproteobacteria bacterium]
MPSLILIVILLALSSLAPAGDRAPENVGDRECRFCHGLEARQHANSDHGRLVSGRVGEARSCEACHGPGSRHITVVGDPSYRGPMHIRSGADMQRDPKPACLACHENGSRLHWHVSAHAASDLGCTSCHSIHEPDASPDCGGCHRRESARMQRSSHMPVREGSMQCEDCHDPHGGNGPAALRAGSVNEVCHRCHADKRGPMLFEHLPVREDCTLCHDPHGSNHRNMLTRRPPMLCQQCHMLGGHPSSLYDGAELANADISQYGARNCLNCHSRIHGSNHPSGARLQR